MDVVMQQPAVESSPPVTGGLMTATGVSRIFRMGDSRLTVLKDVQFQLRDGEFVAIEGRSGSGKSTLLHVLAALDSVDTGSLRFDGTDYTRRVPRPLPTWLTALAGGRGESQRRGRYRLGTYFLSLVIALTLLLCAWPMTVRQINNLIPTSGLPLQGDPTHAMRVLFFIGLTLLCIVGVLSLIGWVIAGVIFIRRLTSDGTAAGLRNRAFGFVFQSYHLLPELNVLENTLLAPSIELSWWKFLSQRKILRQRAAKILTDVGLGHRMTHRPSHLSGGERQRVAIARALMNNPRVLFADEPTGNLDVETGRQIMDVLEKLHRDQQQTIVMVTHDRSLAREADRVLVLQGGKLEPGTEARSAKIESSNQ